MIGLLRSKTTSGHRLKNRNRNRIRSSFKYALRAGHHKGRGINSPYLYHLITDVLYNKYPYYSFEQIELSIKDMPAVFRANRRQIGPIRNKLVSFIPIFIKNANISQTLFRIANDMQATFIVETSFCGDLDSVYLAKARPGAQCLCLTQGEELTNVANETFRDMDIENIHCVTTQAVSDVKDALKSLPQIDFALINTHQDKQFLLDIFQACLEKKQARSVFVLKHIHSSKSMEAVWKTAKNHPDVTVSMDLLSFGVLLFRPDLEKRTYIIRK